jgi:cytochrome bd-type quinol oxidase subunit 2
MGDPDKYEYVSGNDDPCLEATNAEGYPVEVSEVFDAEIISWEYPEPIENSFRFVGFTHLYAISMGAMLLVGFLTILACVIFVKRDPDVRYKVIDKLSIAANFLVCFAVIPFITIVIFLFPLVMDLDSMMYQIYLLVPVMTAFTVAASVALRRKGFTILGLLVQFACPALFFAEIIVESLIYNLFF